MGNFNSGVTVNFVKDTTPVRMTMTDIGVSYKDLTMNDLKGYHDFTVDSDILQLSSSEPVKSMLTSVFFVGEVHMKNTYITLTIHYMNLIGSIVGDKCLTETDDNPDRYRDLVRDKPLAGTFANTSKVTHLDISILDIEGGGLYSTDLPTRNVLLELNKRKLRSKPTYCVNVLVSQELYWRPLTNPTHVNIESDNLLLIAGRYLDRGRHVRFSLIDLALPIKFTTSSNYLIVTVNELKFANESSYVNNMPTQVLGFVNMSKITNLKELQNQNKYYPVPFGGDADSGKLVRMHVTDMYDIKNFEISIRDGKDLSLVVFETGLYPLFNLKFEFY